MNWLNICDVVQGTRLDHLFCVNLVQILQEVLKKSPFEGLIGLDSTRPNIRRERKRVVLKEVTRLSYSDNPIPSTSFPVSDVFFILTTDPSPPSGSWWPSVLLCHLIYAALAEGTLTPYFDIRFYCEN